MLYVDKGQPAAIIKDQRPLAGIVARVLAGVVLIWLSSIGAGAAADTSAVIDREPAVIAAIDIDVLNVKDRETKWAEIARDVISLYLVEGDPFSAARVGDSLAALKACGSFRRINADSREDENGITLTYTLSPFRLIKEIEIRGKYPLFENKVLNAMTVYPGDAYVPAKVDLQPSRVGDLFRREGYIDPDVVIGALEDPADGNYILFVNIDKGPYYFLDRVIFQGNHSYGDDVLKWRLKSWRKASFGRAAGRFKRDVFKKDIGNVEKFYRKRHFFDVRVTHTLNKAPETGRVEAEIAVDEGARYNITFEGNVFYSDATLRKQLAFKETGNRSGLGLRRSIKNIQAFYRRGGFPQSKIVAQKSDAYAEGVLQRNVHLTVDEGLRVIVRRLDISGNTAYPEKKLKKQILTRAPGWLHNGAYVEEVLAEDLLMIKNLYHQKGYLNPEISVEKSVTPVEKNLQHMAIDLRIEEGTRTTVSEIDVEGLASVPPESVLEKIRLKPGKPFRQYELKRDERRIAEAVSEKGRPFVAVEGRTIFGDERSTVRVVFTVEEGPLIRMGNTYYRGNFRTKKRILDREIEMRPGEAYSLKKMYGGQQNIRAMNIFRSVQFNPVGLRDRRETIHMFAEIDEKPPFYFQATGGYESVKGFYAGSKLGDRNFWGLNKEVWIEGEVSQTGYWAESRMLEPRFLGTRISSDMGVFFQWEEAFNQTFATRRYGGDLFFSRKLTKRFTGNLGFRFERRQQFNRDDTVTVDDDFERPRSVFTTSPSINYDSRDSFVRPREGIFSFLAVDVSKGIENSLDNFYKYRFELRGFTSPFKRLTFAGRGGFGDINPYGSAGAIPQDQLFFQGGTSSVRGFDENLFLYDSANNPVGGELAAIASAEARVDLGRNFELSLFYDVGYLDQTSGLEVTDNLRDSVGAGLRYVTPIGAIGILYGHKLDPRPEESRGRVHFSVGYTF